MIQDRKYVQDAYIRVCRDSGFKLDHINATIITGMTLKISPLEVWMQFAGLDQMREIAEGRHAVCKSIC